MILIQETKCNSTNLETLMACIWNGIHVVLVDENGASGILSLMWRIQEVNLNDFLVTRHSISATFHISGANLRGHI